MLPALGVASFLESIIVPIPLEAVLVPLMQKRRDRLWLLATIALAGCVAGAAAGYFVGHAFMETAGQWFVAKTGQEQALADAKGLMAKHGFWFVMGVSVLPIPFQIAMLAAGATRFSFWLFLLATLISRGVRYFGLAAIVWWLGDKAEAFVRKHKVASVVILALLVGLAWLATRWIGGS